METHRCMRCPGKKRKATVAGAQTVVGYGAIRRLSQLGRTLYAKLRNWDFILEVNRGH